MWHEDFFSAEECVAHTNFIMVVGRVVGLSRRCAFLNVYAPSDETQRAVLWQFLVNEIQNKDVLWCVGGDFNVVKSKYERMGKSDK